MDRRFLVIAVLAFSLSAIAGSSPPAAARSDVRFGNVQATPEPQPGKTPCLTTAPSSSTGTDTAVTAQVPLGISFTLLATGVAERLPPAPVSLVLTRVTLAGGAGTETRLSVGPLVFYVETGAVTFYLDGAPTVVPAGGTAVVQTDGLYAYANQGTEPAAVLRLGLVPQTGGDGPIMVVPTTEPAFVASLVPPESQSLVRALLPQLPPPGVRLFLACLEWEQAEALLDQASNPGPIALWVVTGQLRLDETVALDPGGCTLIPAGVSRRLGAGTPPPSLLVFGAVPEGSSLWNNANVVTSGSAANPPDVRCGEA